MRTKTNCFYRWGYWLLIATVFAGLLFQSACQPPTAQPAPPVEETIITAAPEIEAAQPPTFTTPNSLEIYLDVQRGTVLLNDQPFTSGVIKEGEVIATGPDGFAWLYFYGDKQITIDVKPNTRLWVEKTTPETTRLFLEVGSLLNKVRSNYGIYFVVATKVVEVVANGTDFGTEVDQEGNVEVAGLDGEVEVRSADGSTTTVGEDQKVDVSADGKPGVVLNIIPVAFDFGHEDPAKNFDKDIFNDDSIFGYSTFQNVVEQAGYHLEGVNDFNDLDLFQVLILKTPDYPLQEWEVQIIQAWVDAGHGLFVLGERPSTYDWISVNTLLSPYGITMKADDILYWEGGIIKDYPISHPVTANLKIIHLEHYGSVQGGTGLGYDLQGQLVISVYEDIGRVLVVGGGAPIFRNNLIIGTDQIIFLQDALKWLAGPGN